MLWYQQEENTRKPIEIHYNINKIKNEKTWESKACEGRKMGHHLRPNVNCLIMPPKDAEESFLKRPIGSVIIQYELVVLHVIRQLPKRHQSASLAFAWGLQILLLGVVVDCERTRVRVVVVVVGVMVVGMVGFTIHFRSFSLLPNRPLGEAHVSSADAVKMLLALASSVCVLAISVGRSFGGFCNYTNRWHLKTLFLSFRFDFDTVQQWPAFVRLPH